MKNSQKSFMISLIIVIVVILAIGGVFYFNKGKVPVFSSVIHNDWKTYTNKEAGYSIQYPQDVTITEGQANPINNGIKSLDFYTAG